MLKINNIETFYGLVYALRGVSLEVEEGKIVAILGPNGAGKTTLLKTVVGLIEDQPDKGTIEFLGTRIDGREVEDIVRMGISFVPEGREVFEELTVRENLLMGAYPRRDRSAVVLAFDRIYQLFPVLKLRDNQWAGTLSGGEQQMVAIGRALMAAPKLLFLDEPSLGLAPVMVKRIFEVIQEIQQSGVTMLLVEQNARMALNVADYALVMENGRFVLAGTPEELAQDEDVKEFYLGIKSEVSIKGYQRYKRKKRWR